MSADYRTAFEKLAAACAGELVHDGDILGLGSGSAVAQFAKALGLRVNRESIRITIVPSSMQSWLVAKENGLELHSDTSHSPPVLDLAVDGADQISKESRSMIKGGGGALLKEKIIISSSKKCYILADDSKLVTNLSRSVPVEVVQFAVLSVSEKIKGKYHASPEIRKLEKGYPYYTESGNVILDCTFPEAISDPLKLEGEIKSVPGVVECGIFNNKVDGFYIAHHGGTFSVY